MVLCEAQEIKVLLKETRVVSSLRREVNLWRKLFAWEFSRFLRHSSFGVGGIFSWGRAGTLCDLLMTQQPGVFGVTYSEVGSPYSLLGPPPPSLPSPWDCSAIPGHFLADVVQWVGKAVEQGEMSTLK